MSGNFLNMLRQILFLFVKNFTLHFMSKLMEFFTFKVSFSEKGEELSMLGVEYNMSFGDFVKNFSLKLKTYTHRIERHFCECVTFDNTKERKKFFVFSFSRWTS